MHPETLKKIKFFLEPLIIGIAEGQKMPYLALHKRYY